MHELYTLMLSMSAAEKISAIGLVVAVITFFFTWRRYRLDQRKQRAAQTRQDLQAIIGDCNRFLRPLSQEPPYPVLHTATAIAKEFSSRVGESPCPEKVIALLSNEVLLRSICVEGWISSTQIIHIMDIVEKVEREASSQNMQGKLLLICDASHMLAGVVANICSPESFYKMLRELAPDEIRRELTPQSSLEDEVVGILNTITIDLQQSICKKFCKEFKAPIEQNLYLIHIAARAFINLKDQELMRLAGRASLLREAVRWCLRFIQATDKIVLHPKSRKLMRLAKSQAGCASLLPGANQTMEKIRREASLCNRLDRVEELLHHLERDIDKAAYRDLCDLAKLIRPALIKCDAS
jgi:hypothetical protein